VLFSRFFQSPKLLDTGKPFRFYLPYLPVKETVTVRQLLTHTSGLPNPIPLKWIHLPKEHGAFDRNVFFEPILQKSIKIGLEPDKKFHYSNLGYILLGSLIEKVSGMNYESYIQDNIIAKLNLGRDFLGFTIPQSGFHASGYHMKNSISMLLLKIMLDTSKYMLQANGNWKPFRDVYMNGTPYGGMFADLHGIVKYGQELLRPENVLISKKHKKMLFTENSINGQPTGMCLSWYRGQSGQTEYFTHAGGGGGYYCELRLYPEFSIGCFVVFNRSGFSDQRFLDRLQPEMLMSLMPGNYAHGNPVSVR
jgi:D-alanyl-D-alanine carboxypeptidase